MEKETDEISAKKREPVEIGRPRKELDYANPGPWRAGTRRAGGESSRVERERKYGSLRGLNEIRTGGLDLRC